MEETKQIITNFFEGILGTQPYIEINEVDGELKIDVEVDPEHSGIVIGYRGEVLSAMQLILSLMIQNNTENWLPVRLNVNNYREQRAEALEKLARNTAERVLEQNIPLSLPNLSSYERRIIHTVLAEFDGVESYSEGEGIRRVLIIAPITSS